MRQIKFRAWDNFDKRIRTWEETIEDELTEQLIPDFLLNPERYEPMQYTGLKDKNGKEIYEGDFIRWGVDRIDDITYRAGAFRLGNAAITVGDDGVFGAAAPEVIGNIYENHDLLT